MTLRAPDPLELLLPDAPPTLAERARKVTTFLRLLANDGRRTGRDAVHVTLERARDEFDRATQKRLIDALHSLLRGHLAFALGSTSFVALGDGGDGDASAWRTLDDFRDELPFLATPPEPGETSLEVAGRCLSSLERVEGADASTPLWRARLIRAQAGPAAGETAFRELLRACAAEPRGQSGDRPRSVLVAHVAECLLDRGNPRAARAWLEENAEGTRGSAHARRLLGWCSLLLGDVPSARSIQAGLPPWRGSLPDALVALREAQPDWLSLLCGRASEPRPLGTQPCSVPIRIDLGAHVIAVCALTSNAAVRAVHVDAAPALRDRATAWSCSLDGTVRVGGRPEQRVVAGARRVTLRRFDRSPLACAIDPASAAMILLDPVLDSAGEVAGWIWIEFDHLLAPDERAIVALASAWRERILVASRESSPAAPIASGAERVEVGDPRAQFFERLMDELGVKTAQRHWWGFELERSGCVLRAHGGNDWSIDPARIASSRALQRAVRTAGVVAFDEPEPDLALHHDTSSGIVVPVVSRGRACGWLAIESARRRDFRASDIERLCAHVNASADGLRYAQFRSWHRARFGADVHFDPELDGRLIDEVLSLARARVPLFVRGPRGVGKRAVARWLHFESPQHGASLVEYGCGERDDLLALFGDGDGVSGALDRSRGGTLALHGLGELPASAQARLADWLEACPIDRAPRLIATSRSGLDELRDQKRLLPEIANRFGKLAVRIAPLSERRDTIPGLIGALIESIAEREQWPRPAIRDEALALLWRQAWPGNVRELEELIYKLVFEARGREIDAVAIERTAKREQIELIARMPSRHPDVATLTSALRTTRNRRGTPNKTRAALYLGWDPDTLVARINDAKLGEDGDSMPDAAPEVRSE